VKRRDVGGNKKEVASSRAKLRIAPASKKTKLGGPGNPVHKRGINLGRGSSSGPPRKISKGSIQVGSKPKTNTRGAVVIPRTGEKHETESKWLEAGNPPINELFSRDWLIAYTGSDQSVDWKAATSETAALKEGRDPGCARGGRRDQCVLSFNRPCKLTHGKLPGYGLEKQGTGIGSVAAEKNPTIPDRRAGGRPRGSRPWPRWRAHDAVVPCAEKRRHRA